MKTYALDPVPLTTQDIEVLLDKAYECAEKRAEYCNAGPGPKTTGTKHDGGKSPLDLLPGEALHEIADALAYGAVKYSPHNWRKGFAWSRLLAACLRHLFAWARGERRDPESGLSHLAHAGAMLLFLITHEVTKIGEDDLWKPSST